MDVDHLNSRYNATKKELIDIWNEIGLSQTVRDEHFGSMMHDAEEIFLGRLKQERNVRDQYKRNLETCTRAIEQLANVLDMPQEEMDAIFEFSRNTSTSLMDAYNALSSHLDQLTQLKDDRFSTVKSIFSQLFKIEMILDRSLGTLDLLNRYCFSTPGRFENPFQIDDLKRIDASEIDHLSTEVIDQLNLSLIDAQRELSKSQLMATELKNQILCLCTELGEESNSYLPEERLIYDHFDYQNQQNQQNQNQNFSISPLPSPPPSPSCQHQLQIHCPLSTAGIQSLKDAIASLNNIRIRREFKIHEYANQIRVLWDLLDIPESYRKQFIDLNVGRSVHVIQACQLELENLNNQKQDRIKEMINSLKLNINTNWDQLGVPMIERHLFETRFDRQDPSEEMLEQLKTIASQLDYKVKQAIPIITKIKRRAHLLQEKAHLEVISADPKRLLSKKPSTNLKREEKLRRHVAALPSETMALVRSLEQWRLDNNGEPFTYEGKDYLNILQQEITREEEEWLQEKLHRKARLGLSMPLNNQYGMIDKGNPEMVTPRKIISRQSNFRVLENKTPISTPRINKLSMNSRTPIKPSKNELEVRTMIKTSNSDLEVRTPIKPSNSDLEFRTPIKPSKNQLKIRNLENISNHLIS